MVRKKKAWIKICVRCLKPFKKTGKKDTLCPKCWFKKKRDSYNVIKTEETKKRNKEALIFLKKSKSLRRW